MGDKKPARRKRGRPCAPPVPRPTGRAIQALAARLRTEQGVDEVRAETMLRLRSPGISRQQTAAELGVARLTRDAEAALARRELPERLDRAEARLIEVEQAIGARKGDALRADMAVTPPLVEDGEPN